GTRKRWAINSAADFDTRTIENRAEGAESPGDPGPFLFGLVAHINAGACLCGDYIGQDSAIDDSNVQSSASLIIAHSVDGKYLVSELGYSADTAEGVVAGVGWLAGDYELKLAYAFSPGLEVAARNRRLEHESCVRATTLGLD